MDMSINLPVSDPVWIFFIVMIIILLSPIFMSKLKIPHIIGMIFAGILVGKHGFHVLEYDSSFELFGKVGLFYIMFLAGIEMDMDDFRKNKTKSLVFGLLTFMIPMVIGIASGMYILDFSFVTSTLLASMYASHTLLAYPIVSRYGLTRQRSVTITIGGTAITVALALFVLAVIGGMYKGTAGGAYWLMLVLKVALLSLLIILLLPRIGRWFFRKYDDSVMHFVFVMAMVFLGGGLMALVGMEGILGAFLVGLVLNPLIPRVSPLMTRLEFVGNALFIPFFLIGVGMIIDVRSLFTGGETLKVAVVMTIVATLTKWLAAYATQKIYRMSVYERGLIFGLSNAQAVATLAAVLVGHEIILENGERLLNDDVLNGTVVMILFTCIISSVVTEYYAARFAINEKSGKSAEDDKTEEVRQRILIPVANPDTLSNLVCLALLLRDQKNNGELFALSVTTDSNSSDKSQGRKLLESAAFMASSADVEMKMISRYDINISSGIINAIKENEVTDLIIGLHRKSSFLDTFFGSLTNNILKRTGRQVIVNSLSIPLNTVKKMVVIVPPRAHFELGFGKWVRQITDLSRSIDSELIFVADNQTAASLESLSDLKQYASKIGIRREDRMSLNDKMYLPVGKDALLVFVSSRPNTISYDPNLEKIPGFINKYYSETSFLVLYPEQNDTENPVTFSNPMGN